MRVLIRYRNKPLVLLSLLALLVAQAAAGLHALRHLGPGGDPAGAPGSHAPLCLVCASLRLPDDSLPAWAREVRAGLVVEPMDWERLARDGDAWMRWWDRHVRGRGADR